MSGPARRKVAGLVVYGGDMVAYGNPCAWESTRPDDPSASLDELVAALSAQASRDATPPDKALIETDRDRIRTHN